MHDIMVDIETVGTRPGSVILSLGAVVINYEDHMLGEEFYTVINMEDQIQRGLTMDYGTMVWWSQQEPAAQEVLHRAQDLGAHNLVHALSDFYDFCYRAFGSKPGNVWGNGANFDNVLLAEAYRVSRVHTPWKFHQDRCFRTLKNLYPDVEAAPFDGVRHNALADARHQALHLLRIVAVKGLVF